MRQKHDNRIAAVKAATLAWKERDPEGYRAVRARAKRTERARFPEKALARLALRKAVKNGTLVRPTTCQDCDLEQGKPLHGHHAYGYDNPLLVRWLCGSCHSEQHQDDNRRALGTLPADNRIVNTSRNPKGITMILGVS